MTAVSEHASQPLTRRQLRAQERKAAAEKAQSPLVLPTVPSTPTRVKRRDLRKAGLLDKSVDELTSAYVRPARESTGPDTEEIIYRPGEITAAVDHSTPRSLARTTASSAPTPAVAESELPPTAIRPASASPVPSEEETEIAPQLLTRRQLRLMSQGGQTVAADSTPRRERGISFMRNGRASFPQVAAVSVIALSTIVAPIAGMSLPSSLASLHAPDTASEETGPTVIAAKLGKLPNPNGMLSGDSPELDTLDAARLSELTGGVDFEAEVAAQQANSATGESEAAAPGVTVTMPDDDVNTGTDWPSLNEKFADMDGDNAKDLDGPAPAPKAAPQGFIRDQSAASRNKERVAQICQGGGAQIDTTDVVVSPVDKRLYTLTSRFGTQRSGYVHLGDDFAAPMGTPIYAAADGQVIYAGEGKNGRSSYLVIIRHVIDGQQFDTWYVHMYRSGVFVHAGQQVRAGEQIAAVGSNGRSTGPHLHFEVHTADDTPIAAYQWLVRMGAVNITDLC